MGPSWLDDVDAVALLAADADGRCKAAEGVYQDFVRRESGHEVHIILLALGDDTLQGRMPAELAVPGGGRRIRGDRRGWLGARRWRLRTAVDAWLPLLQRAASDGLTYMGYVLAAHVVGALCVALGALSHNQVSAAWAALDVAPAVDEPTRERRRSK